MHMIGIHTIYIIELYDDMWSQGVVNRLYRARRSTTSKQNAAMVNNIELSSIQRRFYEG